MSFIKVGIYHKKNEEVNHPEIETVRIMYPFTNQGDVILPHNGHLEVNYGLYGRSGFFNNTLHIIGEIGDMRIEKKLPLSSCIITHYFDI